VSWLSLRSSVRSWAKLCVVRNFKFRSRLCWRSSNSIVESIPVKALASILIKSLSLRYSSCKER